MNQGLGSIFNSIHTPTRSAFISYHHGRDQEYRDQLQAVAGQYKIFSDNSLQRRVDSSNTEYVMQRIRDTCIKGSSCTIVLCGVETPKRKYVDWEIKATLEKEHGLIGVQLPSLQAGLSNQVQVPERLNRNINSGYALWIHWNELTSSVAQFRTYTEEAISRSNNPIYRSKINNPREIKQYNG